MTKQLRFFHQVDSYSDHRIVLDVDGRLIEGPIFSANQIAVLDYEGRRFIAIPESLPGSAWLDPCLPSNTVMEIALFPTVKNMVGRFKQYQTAIGYTACWRLSDGGRCRKPIHHDGLCAPVPFDGDKEPCT